MKTHLKELLYVADIYKIDIFFFFQTKKCFSSNISKLFALLTLTYILFCVSYSLKVYTAMGTDYFD